MLFRPPEKEVQPRILMASSNYWMSPFQVGSHHLARGFVRAGWKVAFVSDPISPLHILTPKSHTDLWNRFGNYYRGGKWHDSGRLWTYVPAAWVVPHNKPLLRSGWVHNHWHHCTFPNPIDVVKAKGFGKVDILYIDSFTQGFWLDAIQYKRSVYRIADLNCLRSKYCSATQKIEKTIASRVDRVVVPSYQLYKYAENLGAKEITYFPNGIVYDHFANGENDLPKEFSYIPKPIAIYVGVMPEWFDFQLIKETALKLPKVSFVLVGPPTLARRKIGNMQNVHFLGVQDYSVIPGLLKNADVGLLPFDVKNYPELVHGLHPQKLYAYAASGLPVVAVKWDELEKTRNPALLCETSEEFISGIQKVISHQNIDRGIIQEFARSGDWDVRLNTLLEILR